MKPRQCTQCPRMFIPARPMQNVCSPVCAGRKVKADKKAERESIKRRKAAIKTLPELKKEAQIEFNAYIRLRDKGRDCICCPGTPLGSGEIGGGYDAGHYRSIGSAPHLRFDESNVHGQNKRCNRYGAGRAVDYRRGLIERIGLEKVAALEADNRVKKFTREDLLWIKTHCRQKKREIEKLRSQTE